MKNTSTTLIVLLIAVLLFAFKSNSEESPRLAKVNTHNGVAVFTDNIPVDEYLVIGSVKIAAVSLAAKDYGSAKYNLIRRLKDQYPTANGIIISCNDASAYTGTAIMFK